MATIKLSKEHMLDVLDDDEQIVRDTQVGTSRWSIIHELIFKHDGRLYRSKYRVGATEQQDETPWENEDEVTCTEVEAYEKTVTDYRPVQD